MTDSIYLDHSATTPILPEVAEAMNEAFLQLDANPASQHEPGRLARRALENAREEIGQILGARMGGMDADQVVFTSGGTESNNLVLRGMLPESPPPGGQILISSIEHPSVTETAEHLEREGWQVVQFGVDQDGVVNLDQLDDLLTRDTHLVSLLLGNNETGVMQPVAEVARICHDRGIVAHTDAVQVVGKLPVDFRALGVTALTCTAHKFHGPIGIGALVLRNGHALRPSLYGGHQQSGLRPGTEPVALVVGLQVALQCWQREARQRQSRLVALQEQLERTVVSGFPEAVVIGRRTERLPHMTNIGFPGLDRQAMVMALDLAGVACSSGSACASGSSEPSPILMAMGCPQPVMAGSVRFSWGAQTTPAEIDEAARRILNVCQHLRQGN